MLLVISNLKLDLLKLKVGMSASGIVVSVSHKAVMVSLIAVATSRKSYILFQFCCQKMEIFKIIPRAVIGHILRWNYLITRKIKPLGVPPVGGA